MEHELKDISDTLKRSKVFKMIKEDKQRKEETPGQPEIGDQENIEDIIENPDFRERWNNMKRDIS